MQIKTHAAQRIRRLLPSRLSLQRPLASLVPSPSPGPTVIHILVVHPKVRLRRRGLTLQEAGHTLGGGFLCRGDDDSGLTHRAVLAPAPFPVQQLRLLPCSRRR